MKLNPAHIHAASFNQAQIHRHAMALQFGAVVSLSDVYDFKAQDNQSAAQQQDEAQFLNDIRENLGPDELLLVEEGDSPSRYVFVANGEDRSMVQSLSDAAKQIQTRLPKVADRLYLQIFMHLYQTAFGKKFDYHNYALRSVNSAFKMMRHGVFEDKTV
jgi:hypothetical protein